jgi:hypothetical protein
MLSTVDQLFSHGIWVGMTSDDRFLISGWFPSKVLEADITKVGSQLLSYIGSISGERMTLCRRRIDSEMCKGADILEAGSQLLSYIGSGLGERMRLRQYQHVGEKRVERTYWW